MNKNIKYFKKILFLIGNRKKNFFYLNFLFIVSSFFEMLTLLFIGVILNFIFNNDRSNKLILYLTELDFINSYFSQFTFFLFFCLLLIIFLKSIYVIFVEYLIQKFSLEKQKELRLLIINNFFNISYLEILNVKRSQYLTAINLLVTKFSRLIITILAIIKDLLITLSIFVILFISNKTIFFVLFISFFVLYILYNLLFIRRTKVYGQILNNNVQDLFKALNESIDGIKVIKNFKIYDRYLNKFSKISDIIKVISIKITLITTTPRHILEFVLMIIITFLVIFSDIGNNAVRAIPTIGVFAFASIRLIPIFNQLLSHFIVLRTNIDTVDKLYNFIKQENKNKYKRVEYRINNFESLELKNIKFGYPNKKKILEFNSFYITKGEVIGVYGDSGSGKSTLLNILMGYLKSENGQIILNDRKNNNYSNEIQDIAVYLPQNPFLIDSTVLENIILTVNSKNIDYKKLTKSIEIADLYNINKDTKKLLETKIGENGNKLSFGQKQRIIIARSIYFDRELLVMDESTSSLDKFSENKILESISSYKTNLSIIVISHNDTIKKYCDRIYELKDRNLIELRK